MYSTAVTYANTNASADILGSTYASTTLNLYLSVITAIWSQ